MPTIYVDGSHRPRTYTQRMWELDFKTRGIYIALACDVERMMGDIITYCEEPIQANQSAYRRDKIMSLEMGKKIARTINSLTAYNPDYYKEYSNELAIIKGLVEYRNVMAHGYSEYDPNEIEDRYITYYNKEKGQTMIAKWTIEPREFIKNMKEYHEMLIKLVKLITTLALERGQPLPPPQP